MKQYVELPDGYRGHTVICDAEPIETDGDLVKLAIFDNGQKASYLFRWVHKDALAIALAKAEISKLLHG